MSPAQGCQWTQSACKRCLVCQTHPSTVGDFWRFKASVGWIRPDIPLLAVAEDTLNKFVASALKGCKKKDMRAADRVSKHATGWKPEHAEAWTLIKRALHHMFQGQTPGCMHIHRRVRHRVGDLYHQVCASRIGQTLGCLGASAPCLHVRNVPEQSSKLGHGVQRAKKLFLWCRRCRDIINYCMGITRSYQSTTANL